MADQIYKVRDPTGAIREIKGPEGATDEQVIAQAKMLFGGPTPQEQPQAPAQEQGLMSRLGNAALQGFRTGGPAGALGGLITPGVETANDLLSKGAYSAGGAVTDATGSPALGYAANVGIQAIPTAAGAFLGSQAAPALRSGGEKLMRSAIKPSSTLPTADRDIAVKTMLTADVGNVLPGANVTQGGINQLSTKQQALADAVKNQLAGSSATINKYDVARYADSAMRKAANQTNPVSDVTAVRSGVDEFLNLNPKVTDQIPVGVAQELKQGTYANLGDKAYKGTELKTADVNVQKALARGLKEEIEKQVPSVGPLNEEQRQLIKAIKASISREAVAGNKDPLGLGFLASNPYAAAAFMANRSELVKSFLARLLYSGAKPVATGVGAAAGALYGQQGGQE